MIHVLVGVVHDLLRMAEIVSLLIRLTRLVFLIFTVILLLQLFLIVPDHVLLGHVLLLL
jgi:hypothetical protein